MTNTRQKLEAQLDAVHAQRELLFSLLPDKEPTEAEMDALDDAEETILDAMNAERVAQGRAGREADIAAARRAGRIK